MPALQVGLQPAADRLNFRQLGHRIPGISRQQPAIGKLSKRESGRETLQLLVFLPAARDQFLQGEARFRFRFDLAVTSSSARYLRSCAAGRKLHVQARAAQEGLLKESAALGKDRSLESSMSLLVWGKMPPATPILFR